MLHLTAERGLNVSRCVNFNMKKKKKSCVSHKIIGLMATHHTNHQKGCDAISYGQGFCLICRRDYRHSGAWLQCMSRGIETIRHLTDLGRHLPKWPGWKPMPFGDPAQLSWPPLCICTSIVVCKKGQAFKRLVKLRSYPGSTIPPAPASSLS